MDGYPPQFDQLYSVSDLHMGGAVNDGADFQIFDKGERLAEFIRTVAECDPDDSVCLVLNGDVIDSLAEDGVRYVALSEKAARSMMLRIFGDATFAPVWAALGEFVRTPDRTLVVVAGNHDIELGLPIVQHLIRAELAEDDPEANDRILFSGRGAGWTCFVGGKRVFCTHGNEADSANRVDHEKLGQLARAQNAGRTVDESAWTPNLGTRLVVDVMNGIKREYPFVDLLKPTTASIAAVLMTLDRDVFKHVGGSDALRLSRSWFRSRKVGGDLLGIPVPGTGEENEQPIEPLDVLGDNLREYLLSSAGQESEEDLLLMTEEELLGTEDSEGAVGLVDDGVLGLGWEDVAFGLLPFTSNKEALRRAFLDWVEQEKDPRQIAEDDALSKAFKRRPQRANFIVTGHTHRARSIEIDEGRTYYLNSGTWIRMFRMTEAALEKDNFGKVWDALHAGSITALEDLRIDSKSLMEDYTTAVHIYANGDATVAEVRQVLDGGKSKMVPNSRCMVGAR